MCLDKLQKNILPLIAIILSLGAIASVGIAELTPTDNEIIIDNQKRLDEQQNVIMNIYGSSFNNTAILQEHRVFHGEVLLWAQNVTATIDSLHGINP